MSDKHLSELGWKSIVTKQKLKDPGVGKALVAFDKLPEDDYDGRLKALTALEKEVASALKDKVLKDNKEASDYLGEIEKEAGKRRKTLELEQQSAEQAEEEGEEGGGDPAAVKKKLLTMLSTVKQTGPDDTAIQFMACLGKGQSAVLLGKKASGGMKKSLTAMLGGEAGKFVKGDVRWEESSYTFILEQVPGGLAKKLQKALLEETGAKQRVRVRSFDGSFVGDSDTDPDEEPQVESENEETGTSEVDPQAAFTARFRELKPKVDAALTGPQAAVIKSIFADVVGKARARDFVGAGTGMDQLEQLVSGGKATGEEEGKEQEGQVKSPAALQLEGAMAKLRPSVENAMKTHPNSAADMQQMLAAFDEALAAGDLAGAKEMLFELAALVKGFASATPTVEPGGKNVIFTQARLRWDDTRKHVQSELRRLEQAILDLSTEEEDFSEIAAKTQILYEMLDTLDESLIDKLDEAYSAKDDAAKTKAQGEAGEIIKKYAAFVQADSLMGAIDSNPFGEFKVRESVTTALADLEKKLA